MTFTVYEHPLEFYKDFQGILVTDGLEQYHKVGREIAGVINVNCWAHARRDYIDAVKAMGKAIRKQSNSQPPVRHWPGLGQSISWRARLKKCLAQNV